MHMPGRTSPMSLWPARGSITPNESRCSPARERNHCGRGSSSMSTASEDSNKPRSCSSCSTASSVLSSHLYPVSLPG
eukprot:11161764-Lingulodinium_polyedra.AAC.2